MINFSTKVIKDEAQTRLTDGVMSNVEFSGFNLKIADDKEELFLRAYDSMKSVKNLIDASNIVSDISKDFKPNDPKIKKLFELIGDNEDLVSDILSFMYNRIAIESNSIAARLMDTIKVDDDEREPKDSGETNALEEHEDFSEGDVSAIEEHEECFPMSSDPI